MKYLFAREHEAILSHFAWSNTLLALDYDGTLAPITTDPGLARMRPETQQWLERATKLYPTAILSGRGRVDARRRLNGIVVDEVVGNHGLEPSESSDRYARIVTAWLPKLQKVIDAWPGVFLEDKRYSVALHYRHSRQKRAARVAIQRAIAALGDVRVVPGKLVFNVLPRGAPHKGIALERVRATLGCDTAIYVGDDVTDEDVFALDEPGRLLSVRIGASKRSAAQYYVKDQGEIDRLLRALVERRTELGRREAK